MNVWTQVPDAVKSQYQNPPSMLLPAGVRQLELVCSGVPDHQPSVHHTTEAEQQEVGRETFLSLVSFCLKWYCQMMQQFVYDRSSMLSSKEATTVVCCTLH